MATTYRPIGVENLEIAYSSPTFTIQGTGGRALSTSNPAVITMNSKTAGQIVSVQVTANQDFIDDSGASEIINNLFGTTTSIAWANALPFFIYAVLNDAESAIAFMIGRYPHLKQSPAAASIGAPDDAVADTELSLWSLENIDETLYDANPCFAIGSFRMVMSAADDWIVQALDKQDGIGNFNDGRFFDMPLAQNGAATGTFFKANGGTAPIFTTNTYSYVLKRDGVCTIITNIRDDPGAGDGAGAVATQMAVPYISISSNAGVNNAVVANINSVGAGAFTLYVANFDVGTTSCSFSATGATLLNSSFSNGDRDVIFSGAYLLPSF